jgi:hypothetical protein
VSAKNTNKEALRRADLHSKDSPTKCLQTRFRKGNREVPPRTGLQTF